MSVALAALVLGVGSALYGNISGAKKDRELNNLLEDQKSRLEGSRGDISTYFDSLLDMSESGFNLREQSAFEQFNSKSLDIQSESERREGKTGFASSEVANAVGDRQLRTNRAGLESTLSGLGFQEEGDIMGIEKSRTDRMAQLDTDLFNINTTQSQLETENIFQKLFG